MSTDWKEVAGRVALEACNPDARDHAVMLGYSPIVHELAPRVARVTVVDPGAPVPLPSNATWHRAAVDQPPALGAVSLVVAHWSWRLLPPRQQEALAARLGRELPERALLVIGDIVWSLPADSIDEPEQFGADLQHAPTAEQLTAMVRRAGFLPDLHRFGPAVAVMIALRSGR